MSVSKNDALKTGPGAALKALRVRNGWTLADVHAMSGISVSTLSKIETGKIDPNYTKLMKISKSIGVDIGELIGIADAGTTPVERKPDAVTPRVHLGRRAITRKGAEAALSDEVYDYKVHAADLLSKSLHPMILTVKARSLDEFGPLLQHEGEEFSYVLEGAVTFCTELYAPVRLEAGDSVYFDAGMGHAWIAESEERCTILSVFSD